MIMSNANGWRNPKVFGGAEFKNLTVISKIADFDWYILLPNQLFSIFKDKFSFSHLHYFPINTLFNKTNILKDIFQGLLYTFKSVIIGWKLRNKYSLIYASTTNFSDIFPAKLLSFITRKPYIVKYHISIYDEPRIFKIFKNFREEKNAIGDSFIRAILARVAISFLKNAKINIVVCSYLSDQLLKCGIKKQIIRINYNGLDFDKMKTYRNKNIKKKYDLCFIGRIEKNKGLIDMVNVIDKIKKQKSDILAVIIGDGLFLKDLKEIINIKGLKNNILITGFLDTQRYIYLQQSRIFISPTYAKEGFGNTLLEALFFNIPVIAYSHPVFKEIFDKYNSVKLIQRDPRVLKNAILELLNYYYYYNNNISNYSSIKCAEREKKIISEII